MTSMRRTRVLLKFVVALSAVVAVTAYAVTAEGAADKKDAQSWLRKAQTAAQKLNYSGTFVYQQGNQMRTSRITHLLDGRDELEKLEILDGKPREYVRSNDEILCYVPEAKTLVVETRVTNDVFPAILAANPSDLAESYYVRQGEQERVAGHDCQSITLLPKDRLRYGYKLWVEKATGLILRAQTINEKDEVVEQIAFTQISIGNIDRKQIRSSFSNTNGWRVEKAVTSQVNLSGWTVKSIPPGFKKIREVKRLVSDQPASANLTNGVPTHEGVPQREVLQIVFSDGLAAISVFIEPGSYSRTEGSMQQGALNILSKHQGDFWLTIVGEVPAAAIKQVANSIEFKTK